MAGYFTIDIDHQRALLHVRMGGFFLIDDVGRYHTELQAATATVAAAPETQLMLCDITEMKIQSQDIVAAFHKVMSDPRYRMRRVGFVVASTLARTQLMRILGNRNARVFVTEAEAEAWLFGPSSRSAATRPRQPAATATAGQAR